MTKSSKWNLNWILVFSRNHLSVFNSPTGILLLLQVFNQINNIWSAFWYFCSMESLKPYFEFYLNSSTHVALMVLCMYEISIIELQLLPKIELRMFIYFSFPSFDDNFQNNKITNLDLQARWSNQENTNRFCIKKRWNTMYRTCVGHYSTCCQCIGRREYCSYQRCCIKGSMKKNLNYLMLFWGCKTRLLYLIALDIILGNTYHLYLRPKTEIIEQARGYQGTKRPKVLCQAKMLI